MKLALSPVSMGKKWKGSSTQASAETGAKKAKKKSSPMSAFSATAQAELRGFSQMTTVPPGSARVAQGRNLTPKVWRQKLQSAISVSAQAELRGLIIHSPNVWRQINTPCGRWLGAYLCPCSGWLRAGPGHLELGFRCILRILECVCFGVKIVTMSMGANIRATGVVSRPDRRPGFKRRLSSYPCPCFGRH